MYSCAICGWKIYDQEGSISWMNQFRGLYSCPEGIFLTGVGLCTGPGRGPFIAPSDPNARFDDPGYGHPDEDEFAVMKRWDINGRRGFIFHDSCWSLLEQAFHPTPVPHARLFGVCDSLPLGMGGDSIHWGHDYGGLALIREEHFFPWEGRFTDRAFLNGWSDIPYTADPLAVSEVDKILTESPREPSENPFSFTASASSSGKDPFIALPVELRSAIAAYLPTPDVLNARHASKSFWSVFHSQQFWASRFRGRLDRSWLFEVRHHRTASMDWRRLHHRTTDSHIGQGLQNRKRIWALIQHLADILELKWNEFSSEPLLEETRVWVLAAGSMPRQLAEGFCHSKEGLSASTIRAGNWEYLAGISLSTASGEVLRLGYNSGQWRSVQLAGLAGFNLAVGSGGIHALQCIDGRSGKPSAWLGCPNDAPKTQRLALGYPITALDVGFDAFRIVSIAVARKTDTTRPDGQDTLRCSAIWYPDVPPPALDLNEDFFVSVKWYAWGYRPLFWTYFGGPGGIYLPNLIKVAISVSHVLVRIDFFFDKEVPAECRRFGRSDGPEEKDPVEFQIDGPGGEVIDRVELCQQFPDESPFNVILSREEGSLAWFKLSTNRGRACEFGTISKLGGGPMVAREIVAGPGAAITGLFGAQYRNLACGINTFGVVTEPLQKT
ncbi:uncharacterized protein B0H64DRAFT_422961 [Chaetomium fimeti]|uniref:F-box domain-containing protein n=1 Tax=Chaetomium fimeti TaxID=1854472 RepID=A0AAE0HN07_9PEZI|nr:hypothetical protein B0H64DRAFT_422961 [Chaetomium fimeti]